MQSSCFFVYIDISYLAYTDDLLLISRSKSALERNVRLAGLLFKDMGLSLNIAKCEYLSFDNNDCVNSLNCGIFCYI